jgi:hypothetical protein
MAYSHYRLQRKRRSEKGDSAWQSRRLELPFSGRYSIGQPSVFQVSSVKFLDSGFSWIFSIWCPNFDLPERI